jgi:hypothetical protein
MDGLITAIFGLVGVVVGAVVTGGVQVFLDRRKERDAIGRSKRMVSGELFQARIVLQSIALVGPPAVNVDLNEMLPISAWQTRGPQLARVLPESVWNLAVVVYAELILTRATIATFSQREKRLLDPKEIEWLDETVEKIKLLRTKLGADDATELKGAASETGKGAASETERVTDGRGR